jgi:MoaA/NifB/PqqE/SkfB family radical SAM enzyme
MMGCDADRRDYVCLCGDRSETRVRVRLGPDGVHLFDRHSGVNLLLDEVAVPEHTWSAAPRQVSIALTNACDLACSYCYAPKNRAVLESGTMREWIHEFDMGGALGVGFGGGEPTLYRHLPELCAYVTEHTGLAVTMTTHGLRWNADLVSRLHGTVNFVRVSVDGVGSTYERLRGRSFERLRGAVRTIAADFRWGVNTVVNDDTVGDLDAIASFAAEHGADELLLLPQQPTRNVDGLDATTTRELEDWIRGYAGPVALSTSRDAELSVPVAEALPFEAGLRSYAHIDATGTMRASSYASNGIRIDQGGAMAALRRLKHLEGQ